MDVLFNRFTMTLIRRSAETKSKVLITPNSKKCACCLGHEKQFTSEARRAHPASSERILKLELRRTVRSNDNLDQRRRPLRTQLRTGLRSYERSLLDRPSCEPEHLRIQRVA